MSTNELLEKILDQQERFRKEDAISADENRIKDLEKGIADSYFKIDNTTDETFEQGFSLVSKLFGAAAGSNPNGKKTTMLLQAFGSAAMFMLTSAKKAPTIAELQDGISNNLDEIEKKKRELGLTDNGTAPSLRIAGS